MRIISRSTLKRFVESLKGRKDQAAVHKAVELWVQEISWAKWKNSAELKNRYPNASKVNSERVVFNIKGNDYRLVVAIDYRRQVVFVKWLGTHADYDNINAAEVKYDDTAYSE